MTMDNESVLVSGMNTESKNKFAQALGRLGKGKSKRLSRAEKRRRGLIGLAALERWREKKRAEKAMGQGTKAV